MLQHSADHTVSDLPKGPGLTEYLSRSDAGLDNVLHLPWSSTDILAAKYSLSPDGTLTISLTDKTLVIDDWAVSGDLPQDYALKFQTHDDRLLDSRFIEAFLEDSNPGLVAIGGQPQPVAVVEYITGESWVTEGNGLKVPLSLNQQLSQGAIIDTGDDGYVRIKFVDQTSLSVGARGRIAINDYYFDADSGTGSMLLSVLKGAFSFVSGLVTQTDPEAIRVGTPVAEIGIRGTKFVGEVLPDGETRVVLIEGGIVVSSSDDSSVDVLTPLQGVIFTGRSFSPLNFDGLSSILTYFPQIFGSDDELRAFLQDQTFTQYFNEVSKAATVPQFTTPLVVGAQDAVASPFVDLQDFSNDEVGQTEQLSVTKVEGKENLMNIVRGDGSVQVVQQSVQQVVVNDPLAVPTQNKNIVMVDSIQPESFTGDILALSINYNFAGQKKSEKIQVDVGQTELNIISIQSIVQDAEGLKGGVQVQGADSIYVLVGVHNVAQTLADQGLDFSDLRSAKSIYLIRTAQDDANDNAYESSLSDLLFHVGDNVGINLAFLSTPSAGEVNVEAGMTVFDLKDGVDTYSVDLRSGKSDGSRTIVDDDFSRVIFNIGGNREVHTNIVSVYGVDGGKAYGGQGIDIYVEVVDASDTINIHLDGDLGKAVQQFSNSFPQSTGLTIRLMLPTDGQAVNSNSDIVINIFSDYIETYSAEIDISAFSQGGKNYILGVNDGSDFPQLINDDPQHNYAYITIADQELTPNMLGTIHVLINPTA